MNAVFENEFDIERIIMNLNIESGVTITPENTLIILDEIQNTPKALELSLIHIYSITIYWLNFM